MDLPNSSGAFFNMELKQAFGEDKELKLGTSLLRFKREPVRVPKATLAEVIWELRSEAANGKNRSERKRLIEVLSSEDQLQETKTTEINNLLRKVTVSEEQWRAIKNAKRKIRKKLNKRASDQRSKNRQLECETEVAARQLEIQELLEEIGLLERECEFYLAGMEKLQKEGQSVEQLY